MTEPACHTRNGDAGIQKKRRVGMAQAVDRNNRYLRSQTMLGKVVVGRGIENAAMDKHRLVIGQLFHQLRKLHNGLPVDLNSAF